MNDKEFNKGIENLKNISLSHDEKKAMFSRISAYADFHAPKPKQEKEAWIWSFIQSKSSYAYSALGVVLVVSSTVYGAESALPGDILYPFKIHVTESVKNALISDPQARVIWESEKLVRRVEEAEALAEAGKLDDVSLLQVETLIDEHFDTFNRLSRTSNAKTIAPEAAEIHMQAKAAPETQSARTANDVSQINTMMISSFAVENTNATTSEKDAFAQEIEKHRAILQSIKGNDSKLNERIDELERKLFERAQKRAEKNIEAEDTRIPITTPVENINKKESKINSETETQSNDTLPSDNSANVLDSQKGRGKHKNQ